MNIRELKKLIKEEIVSAITEIYNSTKELADKNKVDVNDKFIAYNESYWQWEYDMDINHAFLYLRTNGDLHLVVVNEHVKSGIGAGKTHNNKVSENVGTLIKPQLAKIRTLLKQNSHQRTRAGYPFKKLWKNPNKNYENQDLTSILKEYQNV